MLNRVPNFPRLRSLAAFGRRPRCACTGPRGRHPKPVTIADEPGSPHHTTYDDTLAPGIEGRIADMLADPILWIFVLPGLLLGVYAQWRIKMNVAKYSQVRTQDGITGAQVARRLLDSQGLQEVAV